jgi:hypothetical protein
LASEFPLPLQLLPVFDFLRSLISPSHASSFLGQIFPQ